MTLHEILQSMGINSSVVIAGGAGGFLRALSRKQFKFREVILAPTCGALAAAYLTLPVIHYVKATGWPMPPEDSQMVLAGAFLIGTSAMWLSDFLFEVIVRKFKGKEPAQ